MNDRIFHIKSSTGKYQFVQEARCKHCAWYSLIPGNDKRTWFKHFCWDKRECVRASSFACDNFQCNKKYVLINQYVQLNLFENG